MDYGLMRALHEHALVQVYPGDARAVYRVYSNGKRGVFAQSKRDDHTWLFAKMYTKIKKKYKKKSNVSVADINKVIKTTKNKSY